MAQDFRSLRSYDADGRMHLERCNLSKATVNPYLGREIPGASVLGLDPNKVYKLYRDPDELARGAATFNNVQLMLDHVVVDAEKPAQSDVVGSIGSDVAFEYPYLVGSLSVWTREAIDAVESEEMRELSCAYRYRPDMTPGVSRDGLAYDGVMRDIVANHVALVRKGRAGPDVMVADALPTELTKMRFPRTAALLQAIIPSLTLAQVMAFDAAMEEEAEDAELTEEEKAAAWKEAKDKKGKDAELTEEEKAAACKAAKDKKRAKDAGAGGVREGERGKALIKDSAAVLSAAIASGAVISREDAARLAEDAASKATTEAVARVNALHDARRKVEPLVGVVALDSAEAVFKFALDHRKVSTAGVDPSAFGALVDAELRAAKAPVVPSAKIALDAATAVASAIPGLARVQHA